MWDSNPRPHSWTRMLHVLTEEITLESGALDRSANLTITDCKLLFKESISDIMLHAKGCLKTGGPGHRSPYLSHAKRALYHLS